MLVCVGDVLNLTCPAGSTESIIAGATLTDYTSCTSGCDDITEYVGKQNNKDFFLL